METIEWVARDPKLNFLMRSVQTGRIVHALLFTGPRGTGRHTVAKHMAKTLLCASDQKPCGICPACKQFDAGLHPDIRIVSPEGNLIRVDAIRDLLTYLSLRPVMGGKHIAIIEQANLMNESAQNALLKTLENPAEDVVIFLLSDTESGLLPTILSRVQHIRFSEIGVDACAKVLSAHGIDATRALVLAGVAQGSVGRALELSTNQEFFELRETVLRSLELLKTNADIQTAEAPLNKLKDSAGDILSILELWARDVMAVQNGAEPFEKADLARLRACRFNGVKMLRAIALTREKLRLYTSWPNALDSMLLSFLA